MRLAFSLLVLALTISVVFGRSINLFNHDDSTAIEGEDLPRLPKKNVGLDDEDPFDKDSFSVNVNVQQSKNSNSIEIVGNGPTPNRKSSGPLVNEYSVDPFETPN
uniref:Organ specific protein n=1 Tax=Panagrellus redivivus TaxID=6233 RepID=A0A7E4VKT3_PANRE